MEKFLNFENSFSNALKSKGFIKDGLNYRLKQFNNTALINIQKSIGSPSDTIKYTLNIGIFFQSIFYFRTVEKLSKPVINDCQWKLRIGKMMPLNRDYWWVIDKDSNPQMQANELIDLFNNTVYPTITNNISDKLYINRLEESDMTGTTVVGRLITLSSFYCIYSDKRLENVLHDLKEYCLQNKLLQLYEEQSERIKNWEKSNPTLTQN